MAEIRYTRNVFLRCMNVIYLFAFSSLYVQIPGLFGKNGILPAHLQLVKGEGGDDLSRNVQSKPTLLWLAPLVGLDTEYMMDILALIGIFLSFTGFISQKFCTKPMFVALWSLYFSLFQVGQTFLWFQWDILLLEAGVLCALVAPLRHRTGSRKHPPPQAPHEAVTFWLVRWLLFRLMFSSGIVKLTSGCPQWWGLTALNVHFESMCLPAPLAWYCFHLPAWFLNFNTVFANIVEILIPPLFFFPVQSVKSVAFWIQAFLQACIIISGNFNFFNFLTSTLLLSLLSDNFFIKSRLREIERLIARVEKQKECVATNIQWLKLYREKLEAIDLELQQPKPGKLKTLMSYLVSIAVYGAVSYATIVLYSLKLKSDNTIESKIAFSKQEFDRALSMALPAVMAVGLLSLSVKSLQALTSAFTQHSASFFSKIYTVVSTLFYVTAAFFIFTDSLVPFSTLHPSGNATVVGLSREWHERVGAPLHLTNAYGLFRRMTGVGGRPEIIVEGANDMKGPWLEYHFLYKPGDVKRSLPYVAPHQPRLDWQMWFAALGTYHQNPWLMSLAYRILNGQPEVLSLMDQTHSPFPKAPPKYLRASLYHYHYTSWAQRDSPAWWTRERVGEYFPVFSKDHKPLVEYLQKLNLLPTTDKRQPPTPAVNPYAKNFLDQLRQVFSRVDGGILLWSLLSAGVAIILLEGWSTPSPSRPSKKNQ